MTRSQRLAWLSPQARPLNSPLPPEAPRGEGALSTAHSPARYIPVVKGGEGREDWERPKPLDLPALGYGVLLGITALIFLVFAGIGMATVATWLLNH